jgi:hypothetical protein
VALKAGAFWARAHREIGIKFSRNGQAREGFLKRRCSHPARSMAIAADPEFLIAVRLAGYEGAPGLSAWDISRPFVCSVR